VRRVTARALAAVLLALGLAAPAGAADRYSIVNGCWALQSASLERFAAKEGGAYRATATAAAQGEPFRLQATRLGHYLFYGRARDFLDGDAGGAARSAGAPSPSADWRVDADGDGFRLTLPSSGKVLAAREGGDLVLADGPQGAATRFALVPAEGCATYPEPELNATGEPGRGAVSYEEVEGFLDAHMHMMAFEFIGGRARCGRPWHPYGVEYAMVDCPDHEPGGTGAVLENVQSYGTPLRTHDTTGWPTFKDWPAWQSLTHEQVYYKWLERAWRGGLRVFVNLLVDNAVLCEVYPYKRNSCNEMDGVRLQARRLRELEDYIDAQSGGPGKGWFRVVSDPFAAREVINAGKLAVVPGIEVSRLFDCRRYDGQPQCDKAQIDRQLDEVYDLGVRQMEIINKFDNALGGVAGDAGTTGVVTNNGNKVETNQYWDMRTCPEDAPEGAHDREQATHAHNDDDLLANGLAAFLPAGTTPLYGPPPHCNQLGLSDLGEHVVRRMMDKGMIVDPDHLSVVARNRLLDVVESRRYPGIISSHSWSTPDSFPRIYALGGVITPYAGASTTFVEQWRKVKPMHRGQVYFGFGYGADMNGFGKQGPPRPDAPSNPVGYPFKSFDGRVTLDRQRSGERVYDINADGVAHYGLYPDWIEDLRKIAGEEIVGDMARGAEAYLQMWERAEGIPFGSCKRSRARIGQRGLAQVALHRTPRETLRRSGQPDARPGRGWRWCVAGKGNERAHVGAAFRTKGRVGLVGSTARTYSAAGVRPGMRASRVRGTRRGSDIRLRQAGRGHRYVFVIRRGRVHSVAVAARHVWPDAAALRRHLRLAGLR
jgi:hypothetical protein